nr:SWR1-complex protein 3-like [Ipomoea batatas]
MGIRRFTQIATSDDEGEAAPPPSRQNSQKRKKILLGEDYEEEEEEELQNREGEESGGEKRKVSKRKAVEDVEESEKGEEECADNIRGIGRRKKRWKRWSRKRNPRPGRKRSKMSRRRTRNPWEMSLGLVAKAEDGGNTSTPSRYFPDQQREHDGYWTVVRTGANWPSRDTRELFYSFHRDEVPAESVMHKFQIASNILVFSSKEYDTEQMNLFKLTDKDYEDNKQHEIDLLVQKTFSRLGDLPDIVLEDAAAVQEDHFFKSKRLLRKKSIPSLDVSRKDDAPSRNGQFLKTETPGSCVDTASEFFKILSDFNALTGEKHRDKWLEKLLQAIQFMSNPGGSGKDDAKEKGVSDVTDLTSKTSSSNLVNESDENKLNGDANICWPDTAVPAVVAVEKAAHEALSSDFQKYNQKMRQLSFNFKEGLTAEEIARRKPDEQELIQLECGPCGNTWYASRDEVATLTIQEQTARKNVGTEPLVTPKFDDREKLANAHTDEEEGNDVLKKTTEAGLDSQKSPDEARPKDNSAANNAE